MTIASQHLQFARLVELAEKRQTPDPAVQAHLSDCAACAGQLSRLSGVISLMRTDEAADAPHNAIARAINLFHERRTAFVAASRGEERSLVRRVLAALSFDSLASPTPAFGIRAGQGAATARQLLYSAGENELDVRVAQGAGGDSWIVSGQVLGSCRGGEVALETAAGEVAATVPLNDVCEFLLPAVASGRYTLRVRMTDAELEVDGLELKA